VARLDDRRARSDAVAGAVHERGTDYETVVTSVSIWISRRCDHVVLPSAPDDEGPPRS
jgi:hypothetical protein